MDTLDKRLQEILNGMLDELTEIDIIHLLLYGTKGLLEMSDTELNEYYMFYVEEREPQGEQEELDFRDYLNQEIIEGEYEVYGDCPSLPSRDNPYPSDDPCWKSRKSYEDYGDLPWYDPPKYAPKCMISAGSI